MKKLISVVLVLALALSFGITAFAEETKDVDVKVAVSPAKVHSQTITFATSLEFTLTAEEAVVWKPETHKYEGAYKPSADPITNAITVANHSNAAIEVDAYFGASGTSAAEKNGITATLAANTDASSTDTCSWSDLKATLSDASVVAYDNVSAAPTAVYKLSASGELKGADSNLTSFTVGTITVVINH